MRSWSGWGVYGLAATFLVGGVAVLASQGDALVGYGLLFVGVVLAGIPLLVGKVRKVLEVSHRMKVFPVHRDGRTFILGEIEDTCRNGGSVFSTYLLERAEGNDLVFTKLEQAKRELEGSRPATTIQYDRLIMIDDPTREEEWVTSFLSLARETDNHSGLIIKPQVLAIQSPSRPIVRLLQAILLRVSLTLIDRPETSGGKLAYISLSEVVSIGGKQFEPDFAIAIRGEAIHDKLKRFVFSVIENNRSYIRTLTTAKEYRQTTVKPHIDPLSLRLLNGIEECALSDINIKHVGIFGSVATVHDRKHPETENRRHTWTAESDLDLVVVVSEDANQEEIKRDIKGSLETQADHGTGETVEVEWSKERGTFYHFRHGYHVDIQLHAAGDDYYVNNTPLLGYSIFGSPYHVIYSEQRLPVARLLSIPSGVLGAWERAQIFLRDPLGIEAFITQCEAGDPRIDPRRTIAINLANMVWAVTGMRPPQLDEGLRFLEARTTHKELKLRIDELGRLVSEIRAILAENIKECEQSKQQRFLERAVVVLRQLKRIAESIR